MARITVVNDYPAFLETMYSILDGVAGHEVAGFEGDETTLEQLIASAHDLLIVDLPPADRVAALAEPYDVEYLMDWAPELESRYGISLIHQRVDDVTAIDSGRGPIAAPRLQCDIRTPRSSPTISTP